MSNYAVKLQNLFPTEDIIILSVRSPKNENSVTIYEFNTDQCTYIEHIKYGKHGSFCLPYVCVDKKNNNWITLLDLYKYAPFSGWTKMMSEY